jgi:hypothetical protein
VSLLLTLVNAKDAHSVLREASRYKHSLTHVPLKPDVDKIEEALEGWVGKRKRYMKVRGAHNHGDVVLDAVADERAEQAKADYGLAGRALPGQSDEPANCFSKGVVLCGAALRDANIRAAFAAARRRVDEPLRRLFVELPSHWYVTTKSAEELADAQWADVKASHDVLCLCCDRCEHV